ncbi:MAG: ATP-dependent Clp protease adapter ClpS [bacterium]|nr:ATP-dependent Clp protease adapter ClpS [bacterium]
MALMMTVPQQDHEVAATTDQPWNVVVWNDPINLMSYVTYVFQTYFGYPELKAHRLMLRVHEQGKAVVSQGGREPMETDVAAMHGYGLWATLEKGE